MKKIPSNLTKHPQSRRICLTALLLEPRGIQAIEGEDKKTSRRERRERETFLLQVLALYSLRAVFRVCEVQMVHQYLHREHFRLDLHRCLSWFSEYTPVYFHLWGNTAKSTIYVYIKQSEIWAMLYKEQSSSVSQKQEYLHFCLYNENNHSKLAIMEV